MGGTEKEENAVILVVSGKQVHARKRDEDIRGKFSSKRQGNHRVKDATTSSQG